MSVEHLWHYNESEMVRLNSQFDSRGQQSSAIPSATTTTTTSSNGSSSDTDNLSYMCNVADHRLYKIVKWCKSLPLFQHILVSNQLYILPFTKRYNDIY